MQMTSCAVLADCAASDAADAE